MSTPVERSPGPVNRSMHRRMPTDELNEKMLLMIQLQNEHFSASAATAEELLLPPPLLLSPTGKSTEKNSGIAISNVIKNNLDGDNGNSRFKPCQQRTMSPPYTSSLSPESVGRGTLLLPSTLRRPQPPQTSQGIPGSSSLVSSIRSAASSLDNSHNSVLNRNAIANQASPVPSYGAADSTSPNKQRTTPSWRHQPQQLLTSLPQPQTTPAQQYESINLPASCDNLQNIAERDQGPVSPQRPSQPLNPVLRFLCFGAMDGLLTGSGLVAVFLGMKLMEDIHSFATALTILVYCISVSGADAACMAVGHWWTTRREQNREVLHEKVAQDVKGQLVDLLQIKGMRTMDAATIADTMEGYPNLMRSLLLGESLLTMSGEEEASTEISPLVLGRNNKQQQRQCSAGLEALSMLAGFAMFAVIPPILLVAVSPFGILLQVSLPTVVLFIVMASLGVWKSYFVLADKGRLLFVVEAVLVLVLCVGCAYTLGRGLRFVFLLSGNNVVSLQQVNKEL